ncbi:alcohol dehydrogenase catalytic domain-containing protein [Nereida sp. MMG025]|uniref:alcohol dehydrogenase catalytic domain-containing protein n=1 Tax=Nereida sp. MMG025 TaxID=2909981 RepID=UPI001F2595DA|nr:alcohol dehydrogenase catalytic domain-containing protein [Nereida sp. MMG025]MCF6443177.1 alcohol dehydrogenase catalytic domain-containing protein [Nereida sp. MMG025]
MRAAVLHGVRQPLSIETVADPDCPPNGVVVRVLSSGVCRSDWHVWSGGDAIALPLIPGHEYCGEVVAAGANVQRWRVGDRVIAPFILACGQCPSCASGHQTTCATQVLPGFNCNGSFAEFLAVPHADANLTALPDELAPPLAAALGCRVTTAWHALTDRAALRAGETVAIFGGGGIGLSVLLLAKGLGARVIVVDIDADKLLYAKGLGADLTVDASKTDAVSVIHAWTNGGADLSIEALGMPQTTIPALKALGKLGRMVQVGMPAGDHTVMPIPMDVVYGQQLSVFGTRGMPAWKYPSLLSFIQTAKIDLTPLVTRTIALSQASEAVAAFDAPAPPGIAVITDFAG